MNHSAIIRWIVLIVAAVFALPACAQTNSATVDDLQKLHWHAKGYSCNECNGSGQKSCSACKGIDQTKEVCSTCRGADLTKQTCATCRGVDQTRLACRTCNGVDQTKLPCRTCNGTDLTKQPCLLCKGSGKSTTGAQCYSCHGSGKRTTCYSCNGRGLRSACYSCNGRGLRSACYSCNGRGTKSACYSCNGRGTKSACYLCNGRAAKGESCAKCVGTGTVEVIVAGHKSGEELFREVVPASSTEPPKVIRRDDGGRFIAENGSYYGELSAETGRPKVVFVNGYYRKDGTYVQAHYRSLPLGSVTARGPPLYVERDALAPYVAENGSYYGELNDYGVPKTVHVGGYYRKDGTYVRGHYRSKPGSGGRRR